MSKIRNCVTHHYACDCREEKFRETLIELQKSLTEYNYLVDEHYDCDDNPEMVPSQYWWNYTRLKEIKKLLSKVNDEH